MPNRRKARCTPMQCLLPRMGWRRRFQKWRCSLSSPKEGTRLLQGHPSRWWSHHIPRRSSHRCCWWPSQRPCNRNRIPWACPPPHRCSRCCWRWPHNSRCPPPRGRRSTRTKQGSSKGSRCRCPTTHWWPPQRRLGFPLSCCRGSAWCRGSCRRQSHWTPSSCPFGFA